MVDKILQAIQMSRSGQSPDDPKKQKDEQNGADSHQKEPPQEPETADQAGLSAEGASESNEVLTLDQPLEGDDESDTGKPDAVSASLESDGKEQAGAGEPSSAFIRALRKGEPQKPYHAGVGTAADGGIEDAPVPAPDLGRLDADADDAEPSINFSSLMIPHGGKGEETEQEKTDPAVSLIAPLRAEPNAAVEAESRQSRRPESISETAGVGRQAVRERYEQDKSPSAQEEAKGISFGALLFWGLLLAIVIIFILYNFNEGAHVYITQFIDYSVPYLSGIRDAAMQFWQELDVEGVVTDLMGR